MAINPTCVRRTQTLEEAELIAAWLDEEGIEATVVGRESLGVHAFGATDLEGVGVFVADSEAAERAQALLEEHDRAREDAERDALVTVPCDACGEPNTFTEDCCDTVQECAACGEYIDVPGDEVEAPGTEG